MVSTPRLNWVLFALYSLATVAVFVASLASPAVREVSYAPLREVFMRPPPPIVLSVLYSTEKAEWLDQVVPMFLASRPRVSGRPIQLQTEKMGSREMYLSVLDGTQQPDIISPASSLQISILEDLSSSKFPRPVVRQADPKTCRPVVASPVVLVAWKERADVLWGEAPGRSLWRQLHDALTDPRGWGALDRPEWGYVKFSHTDPLRSNSGFQTILLMTYDYFGKTTGLTAADILDSSDYQLWFTELEGNISNFGDSTGTYMREIVAYGPSLYDFVVVYEATAIEFAESAQSRYGELQVYYPPATSLSDHPFCVLDADWVTPEKAQAAWAFIEYLTSPEAQRLALLEHGFRPVDSGIELDQAGSPFQRRDLAGLSIDLVPQVEPPPGNVLNTLLDFWARSVQR
jgi:ABC-type sulfate transport system substrate-binding protein